MVHRRTKKKAKPARKKAAGNKSAQWKAYEDLKKQVHRSWKKLKSDFKKKAPAKTTARNTRQLLLLLGECNYMARECMRHGRRPARKKSKKK
jgi:hypothetical protein